jgi:hypothetical protein
LLPLRQRNRKEEDQMGRMKEELQEMNREPSHAANAELLSATATKPAPLPCCCADPICLRRLLLSRTTPPRLYQQELPKPSLHRTNICWLELD